MSWESTNTEKFYQATIKLIKYTCLIHFKKDLIPYIKLPYTHSVYLVRADFKEIFSTNFFLVHFESTNEILLCNIQINPNLSKTPKQSGHSFLLHHRLN